MNKCNIMTILLIHKTSLCVCVWGVFLSLYLLVGLLLGHGGRYEAWLARKDVAIQIQWGNMITYRRNRKQTGLVFLKD